jgi:hypothetical protein
MPGLATGGITAHTQADMWGAEANVWKNIYYYPTGTTGSVSMMGGFRYQEFNSRFDVNSFSVFNQNLAAFPAFASFAGNSLGVSDSFAAHNRFYGGQFGISGQWWPGDWLFIDVGFKLALGVTSEDLDIAGSQVRTLANGTRVVSEGGLLALPSNIGSHHLNKFSQVPELDFKVSIPLLNSVTLSTSFSALYWSRIVRPTQQIERNIDITQIPNFPPAAAAVPTGLGQPSVPFRQSDLWLLGLHLGLEVRW